MQGKQAHLWKVLKSEDGQSVSIWLGVWICSYLTRERQKTFGKTQEQSHKFSCSLPGLVRPKESTVKLKYQTNKQGQQLALIFYSGPAKGRSQMWAAPLLLRESIYRDPSKQGCMQVFVLRFQSSGQWRAAEVLRAVEGWRKYVYLISDLRNQTSLLYFSVPINNGNFIMDQMSA